MFLGARAEGGGGEDSDGEHPEWESAHQPGRTASAGTASEPGRLQRQEEVGLPVAPFIRTARTGVVLGPLIPVVSNLSGQLIPGVLVSGPALILVFTRTVHTGGTGVYQDHSYQCYQRLPGPFVAVVPGRWCCYFRTLVTLGCLFPQVGRRRGVQELRQRGGGGQEGETLHQRHAALRVPQEVHGEVRQVEEGTSSSQRTFSSHRTPRALTSQLSV